jgi:SAM-dependent methyltransferase
VIDRSLNYGRRVVARFLAEAGPLANVLDLGAGWGDDLAAARRLHPGATLYGVETHAPAVLDLQSQGVHVLQCNLERDRLPLADASMDAVIQNQVLEHAKEVFWIIHEATRVLAVGGSMILGVPNLASLHNRVLLVAGRQPSVIKTLSAHVRGFTKPDLLGFLAGAFPGGFETADFAGSNFYPFPAPLARPLAALFPTLAWGMFFRLVKRRAYRGEFLDYLARNPLETNFYTGPGGGP